MSSSSGHWSELINKRVLHLSPIQFVQITSLVSLTICIFIQTQRQNCCNEWDNTGNLEMPVAFVKVRLLSLPYCLSHVSEYGVHRYWVEPTVTVNLLSFCIGSVSGYFHSMRPPMPHYVCYTCMQVWELDYQSPAPNNFRTSCFTLLPCRSCFWPKASCTVSLHWLCQPRSKLSKENSGILMDDEWRRGRYWQSWHIWYSSRELWFSFLLYRLFFS